MFHLLILNEMPILEQLQLEEKLLRGHDGNWCLINTGAPDAIVMGISNKPEKLLDIDRIKKAHIPVIKRFSGGGTVYIDQETCFITWICNTTAIAIPPQPKPILEWSQSIYEPVIQGFSLRENDYVIGEKKIGGNALYIQKKRWLLHTSFLWDYDLSKMDLLLLPDKIPTYRKMRPHVDFLSPLKPFFSNKEEFLTQLTTHISSCFPMRKTSYPETLTLDYDTHRISSSLLDLSDTNTDVSIHGSQVDYGLGNSDLQKLKHI